MPNHVEQSICAGTVVFRMNESGIIEFLLVLPAQGDGMFWAVPKGHCEKGESVEETAVRETFEETGVVARLLYELPPVFTSTPKEHKTVHCFLARQLNPEIEPKPQHSEISQARWFSVDSLPAVHGYQGPLIKHAIAAISKNLS